LPYEWSRLPRKGPRSDSFRFIERRRRSSHSSIPVGVIQELYPNDNQKDKEKKVVINVMGRIGQETLKPLLDTPEMELAAVNDIGSHEGKNGKEQSG
jgi:hypothetical protein